MACADEIELDDSLDHLLTKSSLQSRRQRVENQLARMDQGINSKQLKGWLTSMPT
jgi:hypothetical protein